VRWNEHETAITGKVKIVEIGHEVREILLSDFG
jgi:hypothetical protein